MAPIPDVTRRRPEASRDRDRRPTCPSASADGALTDRPVSNSFRKRLLELLPVLDLDRILLRGGIRRLTFDLAGHGG